MKVPPKRKYKHLNTKDNIIVNNKIFLTKSEFGDYKKSSRKKRNKNDAKSEMPNRNKLRINKKTEISDKEENEIKIEDDLISDIPNDKNKNIKNINKSQKSSQLNLLKHSKLNDNSSSKIRLNTNKKSTKKHVKIKVADNNIKDENYIDIKEYIKTDPDDMDYDSAIKRDNRSFGEYFKDNLISDILILNIFCNHEPLNPWPVKTILFILNIELYLFVNALFFTEDYLTEMLYNDSSFLDYIKRFIDRIAYIALIGIIIDYIINFFFYEEKYIKRIFKRERDDINNLEYEMLQIIKYIKIRYYLFFAICFVFGIFIWYYIFCFNNIYPSMVNEWIITSIIIFLVM